jgi:hypothetical protein
MQTFLPYSDFYKSAQCLDYRRLGKQRVECKQILNALNRKSGGWVNHPAVLMWKGYEDALRMYMWECIEEWKRRGYKNTMKIDAPISCIPPSWLGDERLHSSHRSNLLRKDFEYYKQFNWDEPDNLPYYWPVRK